MEESKLVIKESNNKIIPISAFVGKSMKEIEQMLDGLEVGTIITGVRDSSGRYDFDTHIEKKQGYKTNYFSPIGSVKDNNHLEIWWDFNGNSDPYIDKTIYQIVNGTHKYRKMREDDNVVVKESLSPQKGDRVRMDYYNKFNKGAEGTVTGKIGELCWITWDDGTKSKEIQGYLTVIERGTTPVNESDELTSIKRNLGKGKPLINGWRYEPTRGLGTFFLYHPNHIDTGILHFYGKPEDMEERKNSGRQLYGLDANFKLPKSVENALIKKYTKSIDTVGSVKESTDNKLIGKNLKKGDKITCPDSGEEMEVLDNMGNDGYTCNIKVKYTKTGEEKTHNIGVNSEWKKSVTEDTTPQKRRISYRGYIIRTRKSDEGETYYDIIKPSWDTREPIWDWCDSVEEAKAWIDGDKDDTFNENVEDSNKPKFEYMRIEFAETSNSPSDTIIARAKGKNFYDINELNQVLIRADKTFRDANPDGGYDKVFFDLFGTYNGETVILHAGRVDLGDGKYGTDRITFDPQEVKDFYEKEVLAEKSSIVTETSNKPFNLPSIVTSIKNDVDSGKMSIEDAAKELAQANLIPYSDIELAKKKLGITSNNTKDSEDPDFLVEDEDEEEEYDNYKIVKNGYTDEYFDTYDDAFDYYLEVEQDVAYEDAGDIVELIGIDADGTEHTLQYYESDPSGNYADYAYGQYIDSMLEDVDNDSDFDEPDTANQQYTSAATSINSNKLPAVFRLAKFEPGTVNLDIGGGKFDNAAEALAQNNVTNLVYDPYNRTNEHNRKVLSQVKKNGGADTVTCSNVLNVIQEPEARLAVLKNCYKYLKDDGTAYITVYEGSGSGEGSATKAGYQLNKKTQDYIDEIKQVFGNVSRKGKLIIAKK